MSIPAASAYQRILRFPRTLNNTMKIKSPNKVEITFPGGLDYDDFTKSGSKPYLGSMLSFIESAAISSLQQSSQTLPSQESFVDLFKERHNAFMFVASAQMKFSQSLYQISSPKYPITVAHTLNYFGRSSYRVDSVVECPSRHGNIQLLTCSTQNTLVDPDTKQEVILPIRWREKYGKFVKSGTPLSMEPLEEPEQIRDLCLSVGYNDTDFYYHTNWRSYARFCHDACMDGMIQGRYVNLKRDITANGMKSFEITLQHESLTGDDLEVLSWEGQKRGTLNFKIRKGNVRVAMLK